MVAIVVRPARPHRAPRAGPDRRRRRYAVPVRAGGHISVHHHGRYRFTARGTGAGPWRIDLDLAAAEDVSTDCFHEPGAAPLEPPSDQAFAILSWLATPQQWIDADLDARVHQVLRAIGL